MQQVVTRNRKLIFYDDSLQCVKACDQVHRLVEPPLNVFRASPKVCVVKCHTSPVDWSSVLRCCVKNWVENLNCQYYRRTAGYYVFIGILVIQSLVLTQWRTISRYTTLSTSLWAKTRNERSYFDSWTRGSALSSQSKASLGSGPIWIDAYSS